MEKKKIIGLIFKIVIGAGSFGIIFWRLKADATAENLQLIRASLLSWNSLMLLLISVILFPVNWLLESYKWMLITAQTEKISLATASRSVYAGICIGNLAPGRATEFLAKIHFFKPENKLTITLLHFVNGMFQLSVTIFFGMLGIMLRSLVNDQSESFLSYVAIGLSAVVMLVFVMILFNINRFVPWIYKRFNSANYEDVKPISWSGKLLTSLFGVSIIRYCVFTLQFICILLIFSGKADMLQLLVSIWIYFLFTTIIPMFSVIEAAVRAAIALIVFNGFGMSNAALAIVAILLWVINIVFPSIVGYWVLVKEKLSFSSFSLKKTEQE